MEPNESSGLSSSYYHPHQHLPPPQTTTSAAATATASPTNGIPNPNPIHTNANNNCVPTTGASPQMVYSHAVPSAVSTPLETVKRKRGRPRKYGTPEQAAAAKRLAASASSPVSAPPKRKYQSYAAGGGGGGDSAGGASKKALAAIGTAGQSFSPHVLTVNAGEDIGQKIMLLMQQSKREICILSATGSVSNASLRQPATSGGSITYEGRFDIVSLTGSYVRTELGGKTGGLSVCLASSDGQIVGGGVGGPLTAAGPIQILVGSFVIDGKKDLAGGPKGDVSAGKLPSPAGGVGINFRSPGDSSHQNIGGNPYMLQPQGMHMTSSRSMDWSGNSSHGLHQSPENGDYQHLPD